MKITIYTVTECQFSQKLKAYLQEKNLQYEEKNLELNKEWLSEMLAVSNNFAGTPVAKIEKDDGTIVVLKGFTQEEFDATLGFQQPTTSSTPSTQPEAPKFEPVQPTNIPQPSPVEQTSASATPQNEAIPTLNTPTIDETILSQNEAPPAPMETTTQNDTNPTPPVNPIIDEKLGSVLDKLEEKTEEPPQTSVNPDQNNLNQTTPTTPPIDNPPTIPDFPNDSSNKQ